MCLAVRGITGGSCLNGVVCRALRLFGDLSICATASLTIHLGYLYGNTGSSNSNETLHISHFTFLVVRCLNHSDVSLINTRTTKMDNEMTNL